MSVFAVAALTLRRLLSTEEGTSKTDTSWSVRVKLNGFKVFRVLSQPLRHKLQPPGRWNPSARPLSPRSEWLRPPLLAPRKSALIGHRTPHQQGHRPFRHTWPTETILKLLGIFTLETPPSSPPRESLEAPTVHPPRERLDMCSDAPGGSDLGVAEVRSCCSPAAWRARQH